MCAAYPEWDYKGRETIPSVATKLYQAREKPCRLSPLIFMTDPSRVPDVVTAAGKLPRRTAIIYRHFGSAHRFVDAENLRQVTFEREQQLLIGDDPALAIDIGADGVHFKRGAKVKAPTLWRQRCPDWLISMAGLKLGQYQGDMTVLDGLLVSSIFPSESPSAGEPIGIQGFSNKVSTLPVPVFALGGINKTTAPKLLGSGAAGIAGIGFAL
ncbi:thiamine phosphate synthase [Hellea balneolensis]|uniref:thiamine phosphate synthase n=1 Tax=Hellea balneolensis TaxID=287478 RepID=UPI00041599D7|nr:thiamine phosphate synthase [Hellea balneolensis]